MGAADQPLIGADRIETVAAEGRLDLGDLDAGDAASADLVVASVSAMAASGGRYADDAGHDGLPDHLFFIAKVHHPPGRVTIPAMPIAWMCSATR